MRLENLIASVFLLEQKVEFEEMMTRLRELSNTLKKLDEDEILLFKAWFKKILMARMPEEERKNMERIIDENEEVETMKILVTAFDPFGGESVNPSYEVLKNLKDNIEGAEIIKLQVPTAFYVSVEKAIEKIKEVNPDAVLSIGQAGGRYDISVERVAINIDDARIPDNMGQQPIDIPIDPEGPPAYFATIPIKEIVEAIKKENLPASVSNSAGTYVCNHLMYGILNYIHKNKLNIKAGFIHIPYLPEQVLEKPNTPYMSLSDMVKAIETAIKVIVKAMA